MSRYTIVGVVGHIDHGKTTLVRALTGIDTDTHPEEKRRGITIDLGFASYRDDQDEFAFIDAPGHQKYVGNLLAGVSSINIGLLVVACDQGIQAQTLEHLAILRALGVAKVIVVVSRVDLRDEATADALIVELDSLLAESGFQSRPVLKVSSPTGEGIDSLRNKLRESARTGQRSDTGSFRMPIDRVFHVPGRGCVVAGTVWNGRVACGDTLMVAGGPTVRVRGLEVHGQEVESSTTGRRTAINLIGVSVSDLRRGDELVAVHSLIPVHRVVASVTLFKDAPEIRCPAVIQIHTGTTSCEARISGVSRLQGGQHAIAVIDISQPIVATFGQLCLFRRPYPVGSFAGARILAGIEDREHSSRKLIALGSVLCDAPALQRLVAWVDYLGELEVGRARLESRLGISGQQLELLVEQADTEKLCQKINRGYLISHQRVEHIRNHLLGQLARYAKADPGQWPIQSALIAGTKSVASADAVEWVISRMVEAKTLVKTEDKIALPSTDQPVLSKQKRTRLSQIDRFYQEQRSPPMIRQTAEQLDIPMPAFKTLVRMGIEQGLWAEVSQDWIFSSKVIDLLTRELHDLFGVFGELSVGQIRDHWKISRKTTIALLEHFDRVGVTMNRNGVRTFGQNKPPEEIE